MFGKHPFGNDTNPVAKKPQTICCPVCGSEKWEAKQNQWANFRVCECGNTWSGGVGFDQTLTTEHPDLPPKGIAPPEDADVPAQQYTGAGFRDPDKNW